MNSDIFRAIPWDVIANAEVQATRNHSQTLTQLAERGGLTPCEAMAVLEGKNYYERWPNIYTKEQGQQADRELLGIVVEKSQADLRERTIRECAEVCQRVVDSSFSEIGRDVAAECQYEILIMLEKKP